MIKSFISKTFVYTLGLSTIFMGSLLQATPDDYRPSSSTQNGGRKVLGGRGREEVALRDNDDNKRAYVQYRNRGNWDYRDNWRNDRGAFLSGMNQSEFDDNLYPRYGYGTYTNNPSNPYSDIYQGNYSSNYSNNSYYQPNSGYSSQSYSNQFTYPTGANLTTNYSQPYGTYGYGNSPYTAQQYGNQSYGYYPQQQYGYGTYSAPFNTYQTRTNYSHGTMTDYRNSPSTYNNYSGYYNTPGQSFQVTTRSDMPSTVSR